MREHTPEKTFRRARDLRRTLTKTEEVLWRELRGRRFAGFKFRRQMPVGPYIADFACVSQKLIVECDGPTHTGCEQRAHDAERDRWFTEQGWRVLRFGNDLILGGSQTVLTDISAALRLPSSDLG